MRATGPGAMAVLRSCRIEGRPARGGPPMVPLGATQGGSLTMEACKVDVDGVVSAVAAAGPGELAGGWAAKIHRQWAPFLPFI